MSRLAAVRLLVLRSRRRRNCTRPAVRNKRGAKDMGTQNCIAPALDYRSGTHFTSRDDWTGLRLSGLGIADFAGIVGNSQTFRKVLDLVRIVAPIDSTVLI